MPRPALRLLAIAALGACTPPVDAQHTPTVKPAPAIAAPSSPSPENGAPETTPAHPTEAAPVRPTEAAAALPLVRELHRFLARDTLTVEDVVARVGTIDKDPGYALMPLELRPRAPELRGAKLARYPEHVVYLVELDFTPEARPTIGDLRGLFGEDRRVLGLHGERDTIFYPASEGRRWSVAVIAKLPPCHDPHSNADPPAEPCGPILPGSRVVTLVLRRDPRDPAP